MLQPLKPTPFADRRGQSKARSKGQGAGWEFVHVCIDDASRIAFTMIMPDEKAKSATAFLRAAIAYYNSLGVTVARVMTDNGSCYKAFAFDRACKRLKLPQTNAPNSSSRGPTPTIGIARTAA